MRRRITRGDRDVRWIEAFCLYPSGSQRGQQVRLTPTQSDIVHQIYNGLQNVTVTGPLAAYLALLHLCGPEWGRNPPPEINVDVFTIWNATGPELRAVLKRDSEGIACPELGTRYPT